MDDKVIRDAVINALREVKERIRHEAVRPTVQGIDPYVKLPVVEAIIAAEMDKYSKKYTIHKSLYELGDKVLLNFSNCVWTVTNILELSIGVYRITVKTHDRTGWIELAATEQELETTFGVRRAGDEQREAD